MKRTIQVPTHILSFELYRRNIAFQLIDLSRILILSLGDDFNFRTFQLLDLP